MRLLTRIIVGLILVLVAIVGLQIIASESGEVVVLTSTDPSGEANSTRIWIAERGNQLFVRGTERAEGWAVRALNSSSGILLTRGDRSLSLVAQRESDPSTIADVNRTFREKYGWRDALISWLIGDPERRAAVVIRLDAARP